MPGGAAQALLSDMAPGSFQLGCDAGYESRQQFMKPYGLRKTSKIIHALPASCKIRLPASRVCLVKFMACARRRVH
jgi:hypothetical protein